MPPKTANAPGDAMSGAPHATLSFDPTNPFIVQADRSVLVEVDNPRYAEARDALAPFAELEKSPEHIHTYRISNLSLWNAAAAGFTADADGRGAAAVHQVPAPAEPPDRHRGDGRAATAASSSNASTPTRCNWSAPTSRCSRNWPGSKKVKEYLGEQLDDTSFVGATRPTAAS